MHIIWTVILLATQTLAQDDEDSWPQPTLWDPTLDWPVVSIDEPGQPTPTPSPPPPAVDFAPVCDLSPNSCPACDRWWRFESASGNVYSMYCGTVILSGRMYEQVDRRPTNDIFSIGDCLEACDKFPGCQAASFVGNDTCYIAVGSDIVLAPHQDAVGFLMAAATATSSGVSAATASAPESTYEIATLGTAWSGSLPEPTAASEPLNCSETPKCPACDGYNEGLFGYHCDVGPICSSLEYQNVSVTSFVDCVQGCYDAYDCSFARYNIENRICTICGGRPSFEYYFPGEIGIYARLQSNNASSTASSEAGNDTSTRYIPTPASSTPALNSIQSISAWYPSVTLPGDPQATTLSLIKWSLTSPTPTSGISAEEAVTWTFWQPEASTTAKLKPPAPFNTAGSELVCPEADNTTYNFDPSEPGRIFEILCDVFPDVSNAEPSQWLNGPLVETTESYSFADCAAYAASWQGYAAFVWQAELSRCLTYHGLLAWSVTVNAVAGETAGFRLGEASRTYVTATESRSRESVGTPFDEVLSRGPGWTTVTEPRTSQAQETGSMSSIAML